MNTKIKEKLYAAANLPTLIASIPNYIRMLKCDKAGEPFESKYKMNDTFRFIENIPFEKYLTDENEPSDLPIFDIRDFGADVSADFKTNRTAINSAVEKASKSGGGIVLVSGGKYLCANIKLMSNVTLRIEKGSALTNIAYDTDRRENTQWHSIPENNTIQRNAFIYAENAENITIEGSGRLEGNGATYCNKAEDNSPFYPLKTFNLKAYIYESRKRIMFAKEHEMQRYFIMAINYCKNVKVRNLEIYESGSWTCRMEGNENLLFDRVVINNNVRVANSDGIDIMGGKNTVIQNCFIATGDDAVCLKTDPDNNAIDGLEVRNCELMSLANCFKIGTATCNNIRNVTVEGCYMFMPGIAGGYAGIAIQATDGAVTENVHIKNVKMENITTPFSIWLGYRESGSRLRNITLENIESTNCDIASSITGYSRHGKEHKVENVTLKNISIKYREAKERTCIYRRNKVYCGYLNMGGYPESTRVSHIYVISHKCSPYFDLPVYGLYTNHVSNLTVENMSVVPRSCNKRPLKN